MPRTTEGTRLDFPVKGMHCAGCVAKVERALRGVPGVGEPEVNLATERATVWVRPDSHGLPAIRTAVAGVGYKVPEGPAPSGIDGVAGALEGRGRGLTAHV